MGARSILPPRETKYCNIKKIKERPPSPPSVDDHKEHSFRIPKWFLLDEVVVDSRGPRALIRLFRNKSKLLPLKRGAVNNGSL